MLSDKDNQLIGYLRANARATISDLARLLNLSRSTVQNRLSRLEQSGVIQGYSVEFGSEYLNQLVCSHVAIKVKQKLTAKTNKQLGQLSQITELYAISGEFDLIAVVYAQSLEQLSKILDDIGNLEGVERTNSSVILETKFKR
ncbi:Lrp/AsnC family transcriptional regulator [Paraglaciecola hydrolytica]|uniref:AsnC family transcriptional regulator n=1 Tax=Paraglaciecola hydrolytica TaxID=1799789 RepID=A0A148KMZ4_9ALTE|nr:Lrp/AsnC family transcriptional regulator [Paraglaciecola hydrolytica]KXI27693.1 AsnC family transcriptional regulator [Paraglaciecola hydrolytica]